MPTLKVKNNGVWEKVAGGGSGTGGSSVNIDATLTQSGQAADAKAVGDALAKKQPVGDYALKSDIPSIKGLATETYVDSAIASLVNSAPEALNTIDELAAALGDDSNFATTVTNQIAAKQDAITGTAGQFVVIGTNGKPTTKTILIAEEATF